MFLKTVIHRKSKKGKQNEWLGLGCIDRVPYLHQEAQCAKCRTGFFIGALPACSCSKAHKYRATRCYVAGRYFMSVVEARRFSKLAFLENRKVICNLECQPSYPIVVNGAKVCTVKLDFRYVLNGELIIEDTKGALTPLGKLKLKLLEAVHPGIKVVVL